MIQRMQSTKINGVKRASWRQNAPDMRWVILLLLLGGIFMWANSGWCGETRGRNTNSDSPSSRIQGSDSHAHGSNITFKHATIGDRTDYNAVTLTSGGTYADSAADVQNQYVEYTSTTADIPAVKVSSGGSLTLKNCKATKSGETVNRENSGFYGFNAGVLASSSSTADSYTGTGTAATISMSDVTITTDASGANGAFAFGEDAVVNLDYVTIITTGSDNSRGVDATYGGTINIRNSIISTQGGSCAALATDRYDNYAAPTINAVNCKGTTAGTGSPGIYCTGTFNVTNCTFTATGSEAACIEGLNSIALKNTDISGADKWGVMIYQSMSGDASIGTGSFTMTGGRLTNNFSEGPLFFVCNTSAIIELDSATCVNRSSMLLVAGKAATAATYLDNVNSSWGSNGGEVTFTAVNQKLVGDILICDASSSIDLALQKSTYKGAINNGNIDCAADLTIDADSQWEVTGDSYLSSLANNGTITGSGKVYVNGTQVY